MNDPYKRFYDSVLKSIEPLMLLDPDPKSDEGKLLNKMVNIIVKAEKEAGWMVKDETD